MKMRKALLDPIRRGGLLIAALLISAAASADCMIDIRGQVFCGAGRCAIDKDGTVWCSRHYEGGVGKTINGRVLCGVGRCAKDSRGRWFCSSEIGGGVAVDSNGRVRCYGTCVPATADDCENTIADESRA